MYKDQINEHVRHNVMFCTIGIHQTSNLASRC